MIAGREAQWRGGRWWPSDGLDLAGVLVGDARRPGLAQEAIGVKVPNVDDSVVVHPLRQTRP